MTVLVTASQRRSIAVGQRESKVGIQNGLHRCATGDSICPSLPLRFKDTLIRSLAAAVFGDLLLTRSDDIVDVFAWPPLLLRAPQTRIVLHTHDAGDVFVPGEIWDVPVGALSDGGHPAVLGSIATLGDVSIVVGNTWGSNSVVGWETSYGHC